MDRFPQFEQGPRRKPNTGEELGQKRAGAELGQEVRQKRQWEGRKTLEKFPESQLTRKQFQEVSQLKPEALIARKKEIEALLEKAKKEGKDQFILDTLSETLYTIEHFQRIKGEAPKKPKTEGPASEKSGDRDQEIPTAAGEPQIKIGPRAEAPTPPEVKTVEETAGEATPPETIPPASEKSPKEEREKKEAGRITVRRGIIEDVIHPFRRFAAALKERDSRRLTPLMPEEEISRLSSGTLRLAELADQRSIAPEDILSAISGLSRAIENMGTVRSVRAVREDTDSLRLLASQLRNIGEVSREVIRAFGDLPDEERSRIQGAVGRLRTAADEKWLLVNRMRDALERY